MCSFSRNPLSIHCCRVLGFAKWRPEREVRQRDRSQEGGVQEGLERQSVWLWTQLHGVIRRGVMEATNASSTRTEWWDLRHYVPTVGEPFGAPRRLPKHSSYQFRWHPPILPKSLVLVVSLCFGSNTLPGEEHELWPRRPGSNPQICYRVALGRWLHVLELTLPPFVCGADHTGNVWLCHRERGLWAGVWLLTEDVTCHQPQARLANGPMPQVTARGSSRLTKVYFWQGAGPGG